MVVPRVSTPQYRLLLKAFRTREKQEGGGFPYILERIEDYVGVKN